MRVAQLLPSSRLVPLWISMVTPMLAAQAAPDLSAFAWKLFSQVAQAPGNACTSPWSVAIALGMARAGAAKETAREIDAALGLQGEVVAALARLAKAATPRLRNEWVGGKLVEVPAYDLHVAQAAWLAREAKLLPDYARSLERDFGATAQRTDFAHPRARDTINAWVLEQTRNRIRDLLPPGKPAADTRLLLVNCLFLRAPWSSQFETGSTHPQAFSLAAGEKVDVPTMRQTSGFGYGETKQMQIVGLPFRGGDLTMLIAVPRNGVKLDDAAQELAANWSELSKTTPQLVQLELPRFTFESGATLTDALRALGIRAAFDRELADFSAMTPSSDPVFIADVLHKTFIKLDENGTEAAAATAVAMAPTSAAREYEPPQPIIVRADRPFLFAIQHAAAGILFLGRVDDPR